MSLSRCRCCWWLVLVLAVVAACRLAEGCRRWPLPAEGAFASRYAGAMLLHAFFARTDAGQRAARIR